MRPKNIYTLKEYNILKDEVSRLRSELYFTKKQLEDEIFLNNILVQNEKGKSYEGIRNIIRQELNLHEKMKMPVKHSYYIKIIDCVNMGITDMKVIGQIAGKSYASVRRALQDMNMYPLKKQNYSNSKLSI